MTVFSATNVLRENFTKKGVKKLLQTNNVFLFVPNIIDYVRLSLLLLFVFFAWLGDYRTASICYLVNFCMDELDGRMARFLGQTSQYGMILDALIDEASTLALCMVLSTLYPTYVILFLSITGVDFCAWFAYFHLMATYHDNRHWKKSEDWLIDTYCNVYVLSCCWVYGNHLFLLMMYVSFYTLGPELSVCGWSVGLYKLLAYLAAPWSLSRILIGVYILVTSMAEIGNQHRKTHSSKST